MKGTRLWQAPGSPIIQGRSRTLRPYWESWLSGAVLAEVCVLVIAFFRLTWFGDAGAQLSLLGAFSRAFGSTGLMGTAGVLVGGAVGAWLARAMGWRREWLAAVVFGILGAGVLLLLF